MKNNYTEYRFFIQARTNSSRLPNKILLPFYNNKGILEIIIEKLTQKFTSIPLVVCTTDKPEDDVVIDLCKKLGVHFFRGSELNVLGRFVDGLKKFPTKNVIRICADNPFLDTGFLENLILDTKTFDFFDYYSYCTLDGVPVIKTHWGLFGEIVRADALLAIDNEIEDMFFREHVTNYLYTSDSYNVKLKKIPKEIINKSNIRFTIDDIDDFKSLQEVYSYYIDHACNILDTILYVDKNDRYKNVMIENIKKYSK